MSDPEPFYSPDPDNLGQHDAYFAFTKYAAGLQGAGLERSFPTSPEVRHVAIELLAERYALEELGEDPRLIADAIVEAVEIRRARRA